MSRGETGRWWTVALLATAASLLPVLLTRFLPFNDYPFHLARIVVLDAIDHPVFDRFYDVGDWLLPNVALDAVAVPLAALVGPELATRLFVALTILVQVAGVVVLHRVAHGRLSLWPLLATVFVLNGVLRFGFLNYLFGLGLALLAAGCWLAWRERWWRLPLAALAGPVLILCHLEAFGVFVVIIAGIELEQACRRLQAAGITAAAGPVAGRLALDALPFLLAAGLFLTLSPTAEDTSHGLVYTGLLDKKVLDGVFSLSLGEPWLDLLTLGVLLGLLVAAALGRSLGASRPLLAAFLLLGLAMAMLPQRLLDSLFVDMRLGPALALILVAALDIRVPESRPVGRAAVLVAVLGLAVLRGASLGVVWHGWQHEVREATAGFAALEAGATLFSATARPYTTTDVLDPERRAHWRPPTKHLVSYALLEKPFFVPEMFADAHKQPLQVAPAYGAVKAYQTDSPIRVPASADLVALVGDLRQRLADPAWPELAPAYLFVTGITNYGEMPALADATVVHQSRDSVILHLPPSGAIPAAD